MFNPGALTLDELSSVLRNLTLVATLVIIGWKGRSWVQPAIDFFKEAKEFFLRANQHMLTMEKQMATLLDNHLSHLKNENRGLDTQSKEITAAIASME